MADVFDKATRSRVMRAIKSTGTKPELALAEAMRTLGVPFSAHGRGAEPKLPGSPDFVVAGVRLAVFAHGCYWHLCRLHYKPPSGAGWLAKMDRNRRRDVRVRRQLRRLGWRTIVVWEHEDPRRGAARVARRVARLRSTEGEGRWLAEALRKRIARRPDCRTSGSPT
jgi:DNA mismatch endonuclease, patch repair protein